MTVVIDTGDWWIEVIQQDITTPAAAGLVTTPFFLTRGGHFVGGTIGFGRISGAGNAQYHSPSYHFAGVNPVLIGDQINTNTTIQSRFQQSDATSRTVLINLVFLMKR